MAESPLSAGARRSFLLAYGLGILVCVAAPLALQVVLTRLIPPGPAALSSLAEDLGYTFTGLATLACLWVVRRSQRVRRGLLEVEAGARGRVVSCETLLYSGLLALSAAFGLVYYALDGPQAERYARTFLALPPLTFLLFVPRWSSWRAASRP